MLRHTCYVFISLSHPIRAEVLGGTHIRQRLRPYRSGRHPEVLVVDVQHFRQIRGRAGRPEIGHYPALLVVAQTRNQPSQVTQTNNLCFERE